MAGALPAAKLAVLFLKVLTKPLSNMVKARAATNPSFRQTCIMIGNGINEVTARATVMAAGQTIKRVKPLDEAEAVKQGAEMASEMFVFVVFGSVATYEYWKSLEKSEQDKIKKENKRLDKILAMKKEHRDLEEEVNELRKQVLDIASEVKTIKSASTSTWYGNRDALLTLQNVCTVLEDKITEKKMEGEKIWHEMEEVAERREKNKVELQLLQEKKKRDAIHAASLASREGEGAAPAPAPAPAPAASGSGDIIVKTGDSLERGMDGTATSSKGSVTATVTAPSTRTSSSTSKPDK